MALEINAQFNKFLLFAEMHSSAVGVGAILRSKWPEKWYNVRQTGQKQAKER